jgi:hypothetical protein
LVALAIVALILRGVAEASSEAGGTRHTAALGIPLLVEASRTQANYQVGLERALLERDLPTRITLLQGILAQRDETKTAWNKARRTLTAQPDAAAAVARYDDATAQLDRLGDVTSQLATSIEPGAVGADPRLVEVRAAGDLQRAALAELTAIELRTSVVAPTGAVMHKLSTISSITESRHSVCSSWRHARCAWCGKRQPRPSSSRSGARLKSGVPRSNRI